MSPSLVYEVLCCFVDVLSRGAVGAITFQAVGKLDSVHPALRKSHDDHAGGRVDLPDQDPDAAPRATRCRGLCQVR